MTFKRMGRYTNFIILVMLPNLFKPNKSETMTNRRLRTHFRYKIAKLPIEPHFLHQYLLLRNKTDLVYMVMGVDTVSIAMVLLLILVLYKQPRSEG